MSLPTQCTGVTRSLKRTLGDMGIPTPRQASMTVTILLAMFGLNELLRIDRGIGQTKDLIRREENLEGLMKKVDTLFVEVAGRNHIDGIHDAYIQRAIQIQTERSRRVGLVPGAMEKQCELLIVMPTAYRKVLGKDGFNYLQATLESLRHQDRVPGGLQKLCVLVINMSPGEHAEFLELQRINLANEQTFDLDMIPDRCRSCKAGPRKSGGVDLTPDGFCTAWCSVGGLCGKTERFLKWESTDCTKWQGLLEKKPSVNVSTTFRFTEVLNFEDPYPDSLWKGHDIPGYDDQTISSIHLTRRQGLHLSHALLEAARWQAKYIMVLEDDMPLCNSSGIKSLTDAIQLADQTSLATSTAWSMIRVGYGGNGAIIHWADAVSLGSHILKHISRRPVDWLMPEWATSKVFGARMVNANRKLYTYRYNLFEHIGRSSNFGNRTWSFKPNRKTNPVAEDNSILPQCYEPNNYLRYEELFIESSCSGRISPCYCPETGTFCFREPTSDAEIAAAKAKAAAESETARIAMEQRKAVESEPR